MKTKRNPERERWMAVFESTVTSLAPHLAGKVQWDNAVHLFNMRWPATTAAERYVTSREG